MIIAVLTVGTMGLSNTSLGYLNYPTQVIFKCCKLIPVMIGGIFIQGRNFSSVCIRSGMEKLSPTFSILPLVVRIFACNVSLLWVYFVYKDILSV